MGDLSLSPALSRSEAVRSVRGAFAAAGLDDAAAEARILASAALDLDAVALLAWPDRAIGVGGAARLGAYASRRLSREPVPRILGAQEFWGLPFRLSRATLVPRPDTETVVRAALDLVPDRSALLRVLDLGTGSGCILTALLSELPAACGLGLDRSPDALQTARANAALNGVAGRAAFAASDWAAAIGGRFDLVVSNPPYVPSATIPELDPEVSHHDPRTALDGGPDGLSAYRAILADLPRLLEQDAMAVLEVGHDQADALRTLAAASGLGQHGARRDLAGRERVVIVTRQE